MMNYKKKIFILIVFCISLLSISKFVLADQTEEKILWDNKANQISTEIGLADEDPRIIIARIINVFLGFLGIIVVILIMYAGWLWMTGGGDPDNINKAKAILRNAIIGLVIILSSWGIATYIINKLYYATNTNTYSQRKQKNPNTGFGARKLGTNIIASHYPERDQLDVSRNTKIIVTFKEIIATSSIITGINLNTDNVKIYQSVNGPDNAISGNKVKVYTNDNKTFIFETTEYLGSPSEKVSYTVSLGRNILKNNNSRAFVGVVGEVGYEWSFEVGTNIDHTSPKLESVVPVHSSVNPRNIIVQMNFSESVDPISASGVFSDVNSFINITASTTSSTPINIQGTFHISNKYRTVEFFTDNACGVNSCGQTVYCLPALENIAMLIKSASLINSSSTLATFPYDGVVDMAGNSFDGNGDGIAQGGKNYNNLPPFNANTDTASTTGKSDDFLWSFETNNNIDISAPVITAIEPEIGKAGVALSTRPTIHFSKLILSNTITTDNIIFGGDKNYWLGRTNVDNNTIIYINHDRFSEDSNYSIEIKSTLKDVYQNCYNPASSITCTGGPSCCEGVSSAKNSCFYE